MMSFYSDFDNYNGARLYGNSSQTFHLEEFAPPPITLCEGICILDNEKLENKYREENHYWKQELDALFKSNDDFPSDTFEVEESFQPKD